MGSFLVVFGYVALAWAGYKILTSIFGSSFNMSIDGYSSSTNRLLEESKVEKVNKKLLDNPNVGGGASPAGSQTPPDMRGAGNTNGDQLPSDMNGVSEAMPSGGGASGSGTATGASANLVAGVIVGVGAIQSQGVTTIAGLKTQITGPMNMTNSINKVYKPKGVSRIEQNNSNNFNKLKRGDISIQQGEGANTAIGSSKVNMSASGNSQNYLSGNIKKFRQNDGNIYTDKMQIKGIAKAQSLIIRKFTAKKGNRIKVQQITNSNHVPQLGQQEEANSLSGIPNTVMNFYNNNIQKITAYGTSGGNAGLTSGLNETEIIKLAEVYRLQSSTVTNNIQGSNNTKELQTYNSIYKEIIKTAPNLQASQVADIGKRAFALNQAREGGIQAVAALMASTQNDLSEQNMMSLNNILMNNSSIKDKFDNYVDEQYEQNIKQQAIKNVEKSKGKSLEEKEKILASIRALAKKEILEDPDGAAHIIGEDGVALLKSDLASNSSGFNNMCKDFESRLKNEADNKYKKESGTDTNDYAAIRDERIKQEIKQDVKEAIKKYQDEENRKNRIKQYYNNEVYDISNNYKNVV